MKPTKQTPSQLNNIKNKARSSDEIALDIINTADAHLMWLMSEQLTRPLSGDEVKQLKTLFEIVQTHRSYLKQQEIQEQLRQLTNPTHNVYISGIEEARQLARGKE